MDNYPPMIKQNLFHMTDCNIKFDTKKLINRIFVIE